MGSMLTDIATPAEKPLGNMTHPKGGGDALGNVASSVPPMMHEYPAQSRARPRSGRVKLCVMRVMIYSSRPACGGDPLLTEAELAIGVDAA